MIVGHVMGIPVEEGVLQLAPVGATVITAVAIDGRAKLARLRRRLLGEDRQLEEIRGTPRRQR